MLKKKAKEQASQNLSVTKKVEGETKVLKKGSHPDHSRKHLEENTIGMSIGSTINMENYESLRVDVWATVSLEDKDVKKGYEELFGILDETLKGAVSYYTE